MTIESIKSAVLGCIKDYPVSRATLFGSCACGTNNDQSDVDLIMEFSEPISLMMLSALRIALEDALGKDVDLIHGPLQPDDLLEAGKIVELYAA